MANPEDDVDMAVDDYTPATGYLPQDVKMNLSPTPPPPRILPLTPEWVQRIQILQPSHGAISAMFGETAHCMKKPRPPMLKIKRKGNHIALPPSSRSKRVM